MYGEPMDLRITNDKIENQCALPLGASSVDPLKKILGPGMEVTAATIAVCLSRMVSNEIEYTIDRVYIIGQTVLFVKSDITIANLCRYAGSVCLGEFELRNYLHELRILWGNEV